MCINSQTLNIIKEDYKLEWRFIRFKWAQTTKFVLIALHFMGSEAFFFRLHFKILILTYRSIGSILK